MKTVRALWCSLLFVIHTNNLYSSIIAQKKVLIEQATGLIPPLARMVVEYDPTVPLQWLPLIDDLSFSYQYDGRRQHSKRKPNFTFQFFHSVQGQLKITKLSSCNGNFCQSDSDMPPNAEMIHLVNKKVGERRSIKPHFTSADDNYLDDSLITCGSDTIDVATLHHLQYFLEHLKIIWVPQGSEVHQRAMQRSLLMLDQDMDMRGIGKAMTDFYRKLGKVEHAVAHDYRQFYEQSTLPQLLQQIYTGNKGNRVPILYQMNKSRYETRKRKR